VVVTVVVLVVGVEGAGIRCLIEPDSALFIFPAGDWRDSQGLRAAVSGLDQADHIRKAHHLSH
jgi:hypothetical protein